MGYSSAAVTTRHSYSPASGPGGLRNLILRAGRGAFKRLAAVAVRHRLKSVKSKVNV